MTKISDLLSDTRFPTFITNNLTTLKTKEIHKIFPEFGLSDFTENCNLETEDELRPAIFSLMKYINDQVQQRLSSITRYSEVKGTTFGSKRKVNYKSCIFLLKEFKKILKSPQDTFVVKSGAKGKLTLNLPEDILDADKQILFKRGEGLFKVYNKINELLTDGRFIKMGELDKAEVFKKFNAVNINTDGAKIVFSCSGVEASWDIATMSERGVSSCQSWNSSNCIHLIGSILDPCTAIMYLTNGSNFSGKGLKMNRRCLVRFVIDKSSSTPFVALERMYPSYNKSVADKFIKSLEDRLKGKIAVKNVSDHSNKLNNSHYYTPRLGNLSDLKDSLLPYRDSAVAMFKPLKIGTENLISSKEVEKVVSKAFSSIKLKDFTGTINKNRWREITNPSTISKNKKMTLKFNLINYSRMICIDQAQKLITASKLNGIDAIVDVLQNIKPSKSKIISDFILNAVKPLCSLPVSTVVLQKTTAELDKYFDGEIEKVKETVKNKTNRITSQVELSNLLSKFS